MDNRTELIGQIDEADQRLEATIKRLGDQDVRQPVPNCPGWTRGHLLTHIARNGDALRNLLIWARTGVETPAYASRAAREAEIDAGAERGAAALLADVNESAAAFSAEAGRMSEDGWHVRVGLLDIAEFPAEEVLLRRLVEVELHHTDLDAGYGPSDWPHEFATMDLPESLRSLRDDRRKTSSEA